jgi:lipid II isoglutaminyl synthase (glutamine-hydrolysing)
MSGAELRVVVLYPDLLGTYGDGGNGLILVRRAQWRDIDATLVQCPSDEAVPEADIYCLGGGEDGPQVRAADLLRADGTLQRAVARGASVLAVCAGYQIAGNTFPGSDGSSHDGLGLLDVDTTKLEGPRAVGEVLAEVTKVGPLRHLPPLSGFENHGGATVLGPMAQSLARVTSGIGNGGGDRSEGALVGKVVGTYLHGPVLARNPELADYLIATALDREGPLPPIDDREETALRAERMGASARQSGTKSRRQTARR